jgi:predicted ester cyclase
MSQALLFPLTLMLVITTAIAMLASAMLLPMSDAAELLQSDGADVVEQFYAAVNETLATGSAAALDQVLHPSFADENPLPGVTPGRVGLETYLVTLHDADPGLRLEADVISASANQVVTRVQVRQEPAAPLPATSAERRAVWSPIEVLRVLDGMVVGRWGQTDGLTVTRPLAEQTLELPIPTPRVVNLMRMTLAPGTRWDAPRVAGPRLLYLEAGVLDGQAVPGSAGEATRAATSDALASDGGRVDTPQRVMLVAGKSWLAAAGAITSTTNVGSVAAHVLVVTFSEPKIPNGISPEAESLPSGVTAQVLVGDLATDLGTGAVTVTLEQFAFAPDAAVSLWSMEGPILATVEMGQLEATAWGTAWVRGHRDGMSVTAQADVLTPEKGMLLQPDGVVELRNGGQLPVHMLVVTIHRMGTDRAP